MHEPSPPSLCAQTPALRTMPYGRSSSGRLGTSTTVSAPGYPPLVLQRDAQARAARWGARPGMRLGGRYRLLARLGRGGVGAVWEARDVEAGRRVAIKVLRPEFAGELVARERFVREGRLMASLRHRHVVRVEEVARLDEPVPYMVMERLEGPSLETLVAREGRLPWARVRRILLQLCMALEHAHRRHVIHHDIKPANIVVASEAGHVKLVDFGIARREGHVDVELTAEGQVLGSPGYISPEQLRGRRADHRSDLYGLGCTAFHLLTGRPPIEADTLPRLLQAVLHEPVPHLDEAVGPAELRARIEAVIRCAMQREPEDRFASARAMARAVAAARP